MIGRYIAVNPNDYTFVKKVISKTRGKDGENFACVNVFTGRITRLNIDNIVRYKMRVLPSTFVRDNEEIFMCGLTKLYIKEHYLHRKGGPAVIDSKNNIKRYFLFGIELEKEMYLDSMPEDIQKEMVFRINEM